MKKNGFFLIFLCLSGIIVLIFCLGKPKTRHTGDIVNEYRQFLRAEAAGMPEMEIKDFKLIQTTGKVKEWELYAVRAVEYESEEEIEIFETKINFYKGDKISLVLKADTGTVNLSSKNIYIKGTVDAVTPDGIHLKTESLLWVSSRKRLVTEDRVVVTRGGMRIDGVGLEADVGLGKLDIKKDVNVRVPKD